MSRVEASFCRSAPWRAFARRVALPWALAGEQLHGDVLEIGAGSGAMAEAVLRQSTDLCLVATDVDPVMVQVASERLHGFGARASVEVGDAASLPFPDGSFDAVVSWLMLHHTLELEGCLGEVRRVLRPGGQLLGYDLLDTAPARLIHRLDRSPHRLFDQHSLEAALHRHLDETTTVTGLGGLVCRFTASVQPIAAL